MVCPGCTRKSISGMVAETLGQKGMVVCTGRRICRDLVLFSYCQFFLVVITERLNHIFIMIFMLVMVMCVPISPSPSPQQRVSF